MPSEHPPLDPNLTAFATFDLATELGVALRQEPAYASGKNSRALVRSAELTMVLTALRQGAELKSHHAPGPATAVVLEGEILFRTLGDRPTETVLRQHGCAVFASQVQHSVEATKDTLLLILIGQKT